MSLFRRETSCKNITRKELLGSGSFGCVYRGDWVSAVTNKSKQNVAIKIIHYSGDELEKLGRELYFLKRFKSPFIVEYYDSFLYKFELWIVMELCDAGSLLDLFRVSSSVLTEPELQGVMACCVLGLVHIHEQRSIHRDIKAGNILLSSSGKAMLSDFGISTKLADGEDRRKTVVGTPYWMAPEVLLETAYGENVDVWSLGVTLLELAEGRPPHSGMKPISAMFLISYKPAPFLAAPDSWSADMQAFARRCLVKEPDARAQSSELAEHSWLQSDVAKLRRSIADGAPCSLPVLSALAARHWTAIATRRVKMGEHVIDTGDIAEAVDDVTVTETWDRCVEAHSADDQQTGVRRPRPTPSVPEQEPEVGECGGEGNHKRQTWDTLRFADSNFRGPVLSASLAAKQRAEEQDQILSPGRVKARRVPVPPGRLSNESDKGKLSRETIERGRLSRESSERSPSTLGTADTFVRDPGRKLTSSRQASSSGQTTSGATSDDVAAAAVGGYKRESSSRFSSALEPCADVEVESDPTPDFTPRTRRTDSTATGPAGSAKQSVCSSAATDELLADGYVSGENTVDLGVNVRASILAAAARDRMSLTVSTMDGSTLESLQELENLEDFDAEPVSEASSAVTPPTTLAKLSANSLSALAKMRFLGPNLEQISPNSPVSPSHVLGSPVNRGSFRVPLRFTAVLDRLVDFTFNSGVDGGYTATPTGDEEDPCKTQTSNGAATPTKSVNTSASTSTSPSRRGSLKASSPAMPNSPAVVPSNSTPVASPARVSKRYSGEKQPLLPSAPPSRPLTNSCANSEEESVVMYDAVTEQLLPPGGRSSNSGATSCIQWFDWCGCLSSCYARDSVS